MAVKKQLDFLEEINLHNYVLPKKTIMPGSPSQEGGERGVGGGGRGGGGGGGREVGGGGGWGRMGEDGGG